LYEVKDNGRAPSKCERNEKNSSFEKKSFIYLAIRPKLRTFEGDLKMEGHLLTFMNENPKTNNNKNNLKRNYELFTI